MAKHKKDTGPIEVMAIIVIVVIIYLFLFQIFTDLHIGEHP